MKDRTTPKGLYFDELMNRKRELKISIYVNIVQAAMLLVSILLIAMSSQTKVLEVTIPPGDYSGQTFKVGLNDASNQTYEMWAEALAVRGGSYSTENIDDKVKWLMQFAVPDRFFLLKTDFDKLEENVKSNFITSKFTFKLAKVIRKKGYVTVKTFGTMNRWVGTDQIMEDIPYVYEIDMVVKDGNIMFGRFAGYIDVDPYATGSKQGKVHKDTSKFINFK